MPSRASWIHVSVETVGFRNNFRAESLTLAQWSSRSGVTPSNARAPSKTMEQSQAACVRGPMIGTFPSCQSPSKNVQVLDQPCPTAIRFLPAYRLSGFLGCLALVPPSEVPDGLEFPVPGSQLGGPTKEWIFLPTNLRFHSTCLPR